MATVYPTAAGLWSTRTWNNDATGAAYGQAPQAGDIVLANNFAITIDQNITVESLKNIAGTTAVAGGSFTASGTGRIVNADAYGGSAVCLTLSATHVMNGNSYGGVAGTGAGNGVNLIGGTQNGNCTGSSIGSGVGTNASSNAIINGNCTGGSTGLGASIAQALLNGNTFGGAGAAGAVVQLGARQVGNSSGNATTAAAGTRLEFGGYQVGNATGGGVALSYGTALSSGIFFGQATGGSNSTAYGVNVAAGGVLIITKVTDSTAKAVRVQNDTNVILRNGIVEANLLVSASAGRYNIGVSNIPGLTFLDTVFFSFNGGFQN